MSQSRSSLAFATPPFPIHSSSSTFCPSITALPRQYQPSPLQRLRLRASPKCSVNSRESAETFDVVVIGSGLGGLSAAALLSAAYGKSVCVCEAHSIAGGAAHSFTRRTPAGTFTFDSGPHLFSGLSPDAPLSSNPLQHVLLAVGAELPVTPYSTWGCLFPEGYFATRVTRSEPLFSSLMRSVSGSEAVAEVEALLKAMQPLCRAATALPPAALRAGEVGTSVSVGLRAAAATRRRNGSGAADLLASVASAPKLSQPFEPLLKRYVKDVFAQRFLDLLCFLLAGVGANRIPVAEIAFMFSEWTGTTAGEVGVETVLEHPAGGSAAIVDALVEATERDGRSKVRTNAAVEQILTERGSSDEEKQRAVGVRLETGETILAKEAVVSNISAWDLPKLLESSRVGQSSAQKASSKLTPLPSFVHLHLSFEVTEEFTRSLPHALEANYVSVADWELGIESPGNVVLISIPSVIDSTLAPPNHIVLHAYAPATEPYELWESQKSAADYESLKAVSWKGICLTAASVCHSWSKPSKATLFLTLCTCLPRTLFIFSTGAVCVFMGCS